MCYSLRVAVAVLQQGPLAFVRPDCKTNCSSNHAMMHGGPCDSCVMSTNPGRTHRFYTGKAVIPFGFGALLCHFCVTCHFSRRQRPCRAWLCSRRADFRTLRSHTQGSPTPRASTALCLRRPPTAGRSRSRRPTRCSSTPSRHHRFCMALLYRRAGRLTAENARAVPDSHVLVAAASLIRYAVNVTNTGKVDADEV